MKKPKATIGVVGLSSRIRFTCEYGELMPLPDITPIEVMKLMMLMVTLLIPHGGDVLEIGKYIEANKLERHFA